MGGELTFALTFAFALALTLTFAFALTFRFAFTFTFRFALTVTFTFAFAFAFAGVARADSGAHWLRDHAQLEWMGVGGWRTGLNFDARGSGFDALAGGAELVAGFDLVGGFGVVATGRVLTDGTESDHYLEGLGGLGAQLRVNRRVRLRAGGAAGRVSVAGDQATLLGGFLAASVDLFALGGGRIATAVSLRFDADADLGARAILPDESLALALSLGFRY